jgi:hypothetical protein
MPRRTWEAKTKAMMVLAGLKGQPVAERCTAHQQRQAQDDPWRDQCLAHAANAVAVHKQRQRAARRAREHATLKPRVGELTRECTQSAAGHGGTGSRLPWWPGVLKTPGRASGRSRPSSRSGALGAAGPPGTASRSGPSTRRGCGGGGARLTCWCCRPPTQSAADADRPPTTIAQTSCVVGPGDDPRAGRRLGLDVYRRGPRVVDQDERGL